MNKCDCAHGQGRYCRHDRGLTGRELSRLMAVLLAPWALVLVLAAALWWPK